MTRKWIPTYAWTLYIFIYISIFLFILYFLYKRHSPSYIWAYCGKPAARSHLQASAASISATNKYKCWVYLMKSFFRSWLSDKNVINGKFCKRSKLLYISTCNNIKILNYPRKSDYFPSMNEQNSKKFIYFLHILKKGQSHKSVD